MDKSLDNMIQGYIIQSCQAIMQGNTERKTIMFKAETIIDTLFVLFLLSPFFIL